MTRFGTDFRHHYGIFGGESQTSFTRNATRAGSEEGRLFSQASCDPALSVLVMFVSRNVLHVVYQSCSLLFIIIFFGSSDLLQILRWQRHSYAVPWSFWFLINFCALSGWVSLVISRQTHEFIIYTIRRRAREDQFDNFVIAKNKLTSVFRASVLLLIINFVKTLSK